MSIWWTICLLLFLIGFGISDYFGIQFIKQGKAISIKKFYIISVAIYVATAFLMLLGLMGTLCILIEGDANLAITFFEKLIAYGLLFVPGIQMIFTLVAFGKYIISVLNKKWQHIFYTFGIGIASFLFIYMLISGF